MHKIYNCIMLFALMFLLFGCATRAEQQSILLKQAFSDVKAKRDFCYKNMELNPSTKYVHENIVIDEDNSSNKYQLLSSTQKINGEMKLHLIKYLEENDKCRKVTLENLSKVHSLFETVLIDAYRRYDGLFGKLLSGETNIGEFNRLLQEAQSTFSKELGIAANNLDSALANDHNAEIANRQRTAAALRNLSTPPRTTNCNMLGNNINCTSY